MLEILLDPGPLRLVAVGMAHQVHAFRAQLRQHFHVQYLVLLLDQRVAFAADALERGGQRRVVVQRALRQQAGHPHLEELVQVVADNAQVAQPLEQRDALVLGLGQHAPVEHELGQLAVQKDVGLRRFRV